MMLGANPGYLSNIKTKSRGFFGAIVTAIISVFFFVTTHSIAYSADITCTPFYVNGYNNLVDSQPTYVNLWEDLDVCASVSTHPLSHPGPEAWLLGNDGAGLPMKIRWETGSTISNLKLDGVPVPANTSTTIVGPGTHTVTYQDSIDGNRTVTFTVNADGKRFDTLTFTLTSVGNLAPVINSNGGGTTASVNATENQTSVTDVQTSDDTDSEVSGLTYSLTAGADQAKFAINSNTGVLIFTTAPDFENPTDVGTNNVYDVQITVTDSGGLMDVQDIAVIVTDVTEDITAPTIAIQNAPASVANTTAFNVTFEFSEDVTGFALADIAVANGTASNFVAVDGNTYTADITPNGNGDVTIDVAAGVAQDGAANDNTAATQVSVTYIGSGTVTIVKKTVPALASNATFTYSSADADLNNISLTTIANTATSAALTKLAGNYQIAEDTDPQWQLTSIACTGDTDGGSTVDLANRNVSIDLDGNEAIICTFTSSRDEDYVRTRTMRVINNFLARRADQITANEPNLFRRLIGGSSNRPIDGTVGFTADNSTSVYSLSFATSLSQIKAYRAANDNNSKTTKDTSGLESLAYMNREEYQSDFDVWVQGKWARSNSGNSETSLALFYAGLEYRYSPELLVGVLAQFDWSDEADKTEDIAIGGNGWMVGPYMVARLQEHLIFDGRVAWGRSDNQVNPLGLYTDSFETSRFLARGQLTGDFSSGNWRFSPHIGAIYFEENQEAYTDSLAISIPEQTVSLGRVTFGPEIAHSFKTKDDTSIETFVNLKGIWDFNKAHILDLNTGAIVDTNDDLHARVSGGLSLKFANGWSLASQLFYDGIGIDNMEAYGGSLTLSIQLN